MENIIHIKINNRIKIMILLKIINYNLKKKNRLARVSHSMSRIYDSAKYIRIDIKILCNEPLSGHDITYDQPLDTNIDCEKYH